MKLHHDLGKKNIKEVIELYPQIGEILARYEIGCTTCRIGTCLLENVVAVHFLGAEIEAQIETEINEFLASLSTTATQEA